MTNPRPALFLDDERFPPEDGREWVVVRSVARAIAWIKAHGLPSHLSFDNDLGMRVEGRHLALWLVRVDGELDGTWLPDDFSYTVHSQNSVNGIAAVLDGHLAGRKRVLGRGRPGP